MTYLFLLKSIPREKHFFLPRCNYDLIMASLFYAANPIKEASMYLDIGADFFVVLQVKMHLFRGDGERGKDFLTPSREGI